MRLAIIGSREFDNYRQLESTMSRWFYDVENNYLITEVISGNANGADKLGAQWAKENKIKLTEFLPDWKTYGKSAGFIRNVDIIKNCDMVLAFWNSVSKGTASSLKLAKEQKKPTLIIYF